MLTGTQVHLHPAGAGDLCPPPAPPTGPLSPRPARTHPRSVARTTPHLSLNNVCRGCSRGCYRGCYRGCCGGKVSPVPGAAGGAGGGRGAAATSTAGAAPRPPSPGSRSAPCAEPRPPASCRAETTRDSRNCMVVSYHIYNLDKFALLWGEAQLCLPYVC